MRKIIEVTGEGLEGCMGEQVLVWCANYIYTGKLLGVNEHDILLGGAEMVFETGAFDNRELKDSQALPGLGGHHYIRICAIESYCVIS